MSLVRGELYSIMNAVSGIREAIRPSPFRILSPFVFTNLHKNMTGTKIQPAWQTYADELVMLGHGIALWQPAPLHNYKRVNIGDVGYIRQGRFHLLFSAALPLGERQLGEDVPQDFVSMSPGPTVNDQPRLPGALHTRYVEQKGAGFSATSDITCIDFGTTLQFESSSDKGAILLTKYRTYCEDAERLGFFKEYMLRHQRSWLDHANRLGHVLNLEDLVFITGHDTTLDFAMLSFSSNYRRIGIEFEAGFPAVASTSASVWGTWRTSTSVHHNCGPQHLSPTHDDDDARSIDSMQSLEDPLSECNQCVFLRGFRIRRRAGLFPTVIKAAAGPHDLGSGPRDSSKEPLLSRGNDEKNDSDFEIISDTPSRFGDPLEPIFRYIFEHSTADVAIMNDSDLARLFKVTGVSRGENMRTLISQLNPKMIETSQDGIACIKDTLSQVYNSTKPVVSRLGGDVTSSNKQFQKKFLRKRERKIKSEEWLQSPQGPVGDMYEGGLLPNDFESFLSGMPEDAYARNVTNVPREYQRSSTSLRVRSSDSADSSHQNHLIARSHSAAASHLGNAQGAFQKPDRETVSTSFSPRTNRPSRKILHNPRSASFASSAPSITTARTSFSEDCDADSPNSLQRAPSTPVVHSPRSISSRPDGSYKLTDFRSERTIGAGSFGRVHLARNIHNGRYYAVKVLAKEKVVRLKQVEHTRNERQLLSNVHNPFIINVWGAFQDSTNLYMVMDFVAGGELFTLLRKAKRFPDPVAKFYAAEVAIALHHLHSQDIIHRDLKPENILLGRDGHIKLTDFGFAKIVPDITWTLCGTPDYLAPELVSGLHYNKSVDWYALGILIFEMLAGYPPFHSEDQNHIELYRRIQAGNVRYPTAMEPNAIDLIKCFLHSDLSERYGNLNHGTNDIFAHPWFAEVHWDKLYRREVPAPFIPDITGDGDSSAFERYPEMGLQNYGSPAPDLHGHLFPEFAYTR